MRAALLLLLAVAARGAELPEPPTTLRLQAIETFRAGRYREAARLYELEASTRPFDLDALRDSVWALWYSGQYGRTARQGLRLVEKLPEDLESLNLTARALLITRQRVPALRLYLRSLGVDARQAAPRRAVARIYEWLRQYESAVRWAEDVLIDHPEDASMHALIGRVRFYQERYRQSARAWSEAVSLEPDSSDFALALAVALYFDGKKERALALARGVVARDEGYWPAVEFLSSVAILEGRPDEAFALYQAALSPLRREDHGRLMRLARLYERFGKHAEFDAALDRLLAADPGDTEALLAKAGALVKGGRAADAEPLYRRALRWDETQGDGLKGLAHSLALSSRSIESLETLSRARALSPSDPDLLLMESNQLYRLGEQRRAKKLLVDWLEGDADREAPALILRYHGLTARPDDPILSNPMHMTAAAFSAQLSALKEAGFAAVTSAEVDAWENGRAELPRRSVLLIFEDARLRTLRLADPILAALGFKAAVSVDRRAVEAESPAHPRWSDLRALEKTGRWELVVKPRPRRGAPAEREAVDLDWNPAITIEADPRADWKAESVPALLAEKDPRLRVRRTLLARAAWERRPREALFWLEKNREAGAPQDVLFADEARIRWAVGDRALGLQLARRALRLDREEEHEALVETFRRQLRPWLTATAQYFEDNRDRSHLRFDAAAGPFVAGRFMLTALHGDAFYREAGRPTARGHSAGLEASRGLGLRGMLHARLVGHLLPGRPDALSGSLAARTRWADAFDSQVELGQALYATQRALEAGVREHYASLSATHARPESLRVTTRARAAHITDDNERLTGQLVVSHPVHPDLPALRLVYQGAVDATRRRSPNYYSPQALVMNQLGVQFLPALSRRASAELQYLPGYGSESGSPGRFVHRFDASLSWTWRERLVVKPFAALTRSPLYRSRSYGLSLAARF